MNPKFNVSLALIAALREYQSGGHFRDGLVAAKFEDLTAAEQPNLNHLFTEAVRYYNVHLRHIQSFLHKKPQKKFYDYVMAVLVAGTTEILRSRAADNVVLSKYTDIVKQSKKTAHLSGVVRAVLGNIERHKDELLNDYQDHTLIFHKEFLKKLRKNYKDKADDICAWLLKPSDIGMTILDKDFKPKDIEMNAAHHFTLPSGHSVTGFKGFRDGAVTVQSLTSSLPLAALGDLSGKMVFDLCSAPGGKSLQASAQNADVVAVDISEKRLKKMGENIDRTGLHCELIVSNALDFNPDEKADIILLDAPCSATGTMRKNPDLIARTDLKDEKGLVGLQTQLLNHSKTLLKADGTLIYATCSLSKSEGEAIIKTFLYENPEFEAFIPEFYKDYDFIFDDNMIRILPCHRPEQGGMDGFFTCYLRCKV